MPALRMSSGAVEDLLTAAIGRAAQALTPATLLTIAARIEELPAPGPAAQAAMREAFPNRATQDRAVRIVKRWEQEASDLSSAAVARAVRSAADTARRLREEQEIRLVVTGPDSPIVPVRATREVVCELLAEAKDRALLVTFNVWPDPAVFDAMQKAANHDVRVDLIRETWSPNGQWSDHGAHISPKINLWRWPEPRAGNARVHAKLVIADERVALVTSANLTGAAMDRNMEAGVLVRGGSLPRVLSRHFRTLMSSGKLEEG